MLNSEYHKQMEETVVKLMEKGKGILAADESMNTIGAKFKKLNIENSEENRRAYRDMLLSTPNLEKYISGVILFEETIAQKSSNGQNFLELLNSKNIIPGIKLDKGLSEIPNSPLEKTTLGFDELDKRSKDFYSKGLRFAKWRCVIKILKSANLPSEVSLMETATGLAKYAAICQKNGLVPIVEPEVLVEGNHNISECANVTQNILCRLFNELNNYGVNLKATILKVNMAVEGSDSKKNNKEDVAKYTLNMLKNSCPYNLGGVVFLSGGQNENEASIHLNEINKVNDCGLKMSFSFGRALQNSPINAWAGKADNFERGQKELLLAAERNGIAYMGQLDNNLKSSEFGDQTLFEKNYTY